MKLFVTGAGGLLGSAIVKSAHTKHAVFSGFRQHRPSHGTPIMMDLTDLDEIRKLVNELKPEAIIHAAAFTDVDKCETEKPATNRVNHEATELLSSIAAALGAYFLYVSTDAVFDGERGMYRETDEPRPINYYGTTKLLGEKSVMASGAEYCVTRASVIYGPRPAAQKKNFALWVIEKLKSGEPVKIVSDQFVSPSLNSNVAEMVIELMERRFTGIYHISGATRVSRYEFSKALAEVFGLDASLIVPVPMSEMKWVARRPKDSSLDVSRATASLARPPLYLQPSLERLKRELEF